MVEVNTNDFGRSYRRVVQQEKFVQAAIKIADEQIPGENLGNVLDEKFGIIDVDNIEHVVEAHRGDIKWWEKTLATVENRFAYAVKVLVEADEGLIHYLQEEIYRLGQKIEPEYEDKPMGDIYNLIRNLLLDGGVNEELNRIVSEDYDEVVWTRSRPTTQKYWTIHDVDFNKYYIPLRRSFVYGLLEKTDVKFSTLDDAVFVLSRR